MEKQVRDFLLEVKNNFLAVRFNIYLSSKHRNFLEWKSTKKGDSISKIIREYIERDEEDYKEYLGDI